MAFPSWPGMARHFQAAKRLKMEPAASRASRWASWKKARRAFFSVSLSHSVEGIDQLFRRFIVQTSEQIGYGRLELGGIGLENDLLDFQ